MRGGLIPRRRRRRRHPEGARLSLTEIDGVATEELFATTADEAGATPATEFVIDLPRIEKAPEPLPRRIDGSRGRLRSQAALTRRSS